jgi:hypothetical protein
MIAEIIELVQKTDFKNVGGKYEIAKGKHELNLKTQIKLLLCRLKRK